MSPELAKALARQRLEAKKYEARRKAIREEIEQIRAAGKSIARHKAKKKKI